MTSPLPTDRAATYGSSPTDASKLVHEQDHDAIAARVNQHDQALAATAATSAPTPKTGPYTLVLADNGQFLSITNSAPTSVTIPTDAQVAFPVGQTELRVLQYGAGQVTFVSGGGSTSTPTTTSSTAVVSVRSSASSQRSTPDSNLCVVTMPPTIVAGDGLLVQIATADELQTWSPPAGWAQVGVGQGPAGSGGYLFKRVNAPASLAGTTVTFTITGNTSGQTTNVPFAASALALAGADTTDFIDGVAGTGTTNTQNTPTLTTVADGCLEIGMVHAASGASVEAAATYSGSSLVSDTQINTSGASANARESIAHGAAGPRPAGTLLASKTSWSAGGYGGARTVAVKPLVTTTTTTTTSGGVALRSAGGAVRTAAQYATAVLTKIGPNEWLIDGYIA